MVSISKKVEMDTLDNGGCGVPSEVDARTRSAAYIAVEFKLHHEHLFALELERKALLADLTSLTEQFCAAVASHRANSNGEAIGPTIGSRTRGVKSERDSSGGGAATPAAFAALGKKIGDVEQAIEANLQKKARLWEVWTE